ncbi:MAG: cytochrome [Planctomycetaceae bacterium]|nr:cytochrome [Planctomycetaceae bacterium]
MSMYTQALDDNLRRRVQGLLDHLSHWLPVTDPPEHGRLRRLISQAFTPRMLQELRPRIEKLAAEQMTYAAQSVEMDFFGDYCYPLPANVICEMMGIPVTERDAYREWSDGVMNFSTRAGPTLRHYAESANAALANLKAMFDDLIDQRRRGGGSDLLSALITAEDEGESLTHDELLALCVFLFIAGHETTTNVIANGMVGFFDNPEQFEILKADVDGKVFGAVEEVLRFDNSVTRGVRQAGEDMILRDKHIKAGDIVILVLLAANRDPEQFPDPDKFDIERDPNKHVSFGWVPHFCVGGPLARIEIEVTLRQIVKQVPDIRPAYDTLTRRDTMGVRALTNLPVRY